jgi:flagellar motor protein MotB
MNTTAAQTTQPTHNQTTQTQPSSDLSNTPNNKRNQIPCVASIAGVSVTALLVALLVYSSSPYQTSIQVPKVAVKVNSTSMILKPMSVTAVNAQNHFTLNGSVPSQAHKNAIENELRATFGEGRYTNNLSVNEQLKPAKWLDHIKGFFDFFKLPGSELSAQADVLTLSGTATPLKETISNFLGVDTTVKALDIASNVTAANTNALTVLEGLSENSETTAILEALNLQIINFASGSTAIPKQNQELLKKAAALLKTKVSPFEIAGHADNIGQETSNLKLSERRAKSVTF